MFQTIGGAIVLAVFHAGICTAADRIHLDSATYVGGSGEDWIQDLSVDVVGGEEVVTIAGVCTKSGSFSFLGDTIQPGDSDAFVARLSNDGTRMHWMVSIGGPGVDGAMALDVDEEGNVAVAGWASAGFPTTPGAFETAHATSVDAFVAVLDDSGSVVYSTLLGGDLEDVASSVVMSTCGEVFVCGYTSSWNFPTIAGAYLPSFNGGTFDNFVCRLKPDASLSPESQLVYSTFLGGSGDEALPGRFLDRVTHRAIALVNDETVVLTGHTSSYDFPTTQEALGPGSLGSTDIYLTMLTCSPDLPTDEQLDCSFCFGGSLAETAALLVIDDQQNAVVAGWTASTDFPVTPDAFQARRAGSTVNSDGFLAHISLEPGLSTADRLLYSTYLGGSANEGPDGIGFRPPALVAITGWTFSADYPAVNADQTPADTMNAFLTLINLDGSVEPNERILYSGRVGGSSYDQGSGAGIADAGRVLIAGITTAGNFPAISADAVDTVFAGTSEGFVAWFSGGSWVEGQFKRGDANASNVIDIADAIFCLGYLFAQETAPSCFKAADANDDGVVDIADAITILGHLFANTGPLVAPFEECGSDLTDDKLECAEYAPCDS